MAADGVTLLAFWVGDHAYHVRAENGDGTQQWYVFEAEPSNDVSLSDEERLRLGALMASVLPMSNGHVAFPRGSSGRVVYRVWHSRGDAAASRTTIRGVRAARSRRLPA